jgi:hypothetical protein
MPRTDGTAKVLLLALLMSAWPALARALDISFRAPHECGSDADFVSRVTAVVGLDFHSTEKVAVLVERDDAGLYVMRVTLSDGTRVLSHPSCGALFESAVVITTLRLNPTLAQPAPPPPPRAPAALPASVDTPPRAERRVRPAAAWFQAGISRGVVPGWAFAAGLGARVGARWLAFGAALHYLAPRDAESERVSVQAAGARVLLLATPPPGFVWLGVGLEGDLLFGRGENLDRVTRDIVTRGAGCAEAGVRLFAHGRHELALAANLAVAFQRAAFRTRLESAALPARHVVVYRPETWSFNAALRWQLHFGR